MKFGGIWISLLDALEFEFYLDVWILLPKIYKHLQALEV